VPTAAVKRLDRVLKQARTELEKHLEEIDRIDFQEQAEDFIAALQRDKILPEDFRPPASP
jgi:transposase